MHVMSQCLEANKEKNRRVLVVTIARLKTE